MRLSFKQRLVGALLLGALVPLLVTSAIIFTQVRETTLKLVSQQLSAGSDDVVSSAKKFFATVNNDLDVLSINPKVVEALIDLTAAVNDPALQSGAVDEEAFQARYAYQKDNTPGSTDTDMQSWMPKDSAARVLQSAYIATNPNKIGEKDKLDQARDGSEYSRLHAMYHPYLHAVQQRYGYYDIFLVDKASERIVYTVFKEVDYMTSLKDGPYAQTGLGQAVRKALNSTDPNAVFYADFAPYAPSYNAPAAFAATPVIQDGKTIGAIAFQLPADKIQNLFDDINALGFSGYFVNEDGHLEVNYKHKKMGETIPEHLQAMFAEVRETASKGIRTYLGMTGATMYGAVQWVKFDNGLSWGVTVAVPESQMMAEVNNILYMMLAVIGVTVLVLLLAGLWVGGVLVKPVQKLAQRFNASAEKVGRATGEVGEAVSSMIAASEETSAQSVVVRRNSGEAAGYVSTVSGAIDELNVSINDISQSITETNTLIEDAVFKAQHTDEVVRNLGEAGKKISDVVNLINDLAEQTNLLALNAAIEAARAGDAGRGFAVVADEVKKLASHTSGATVEISNQIRSIQQVSEQSVTALHAVVQAIHRIRDNATTVSAAVEEQGSVARQIAGNVRDAASRVQQVDENMVGIEQAANDTGVSADQVSKSVNEVQDAFGQLRQDVDGVLSEMGVKR